MEEGGILRDGDKISKHLKRIGEHYKDHVQADEWLMVDCRMKGVPRKRDLNLCTLLFSDDCRECTCYMRGDAPDKETIKLRD